jgi:hypothetical protein
MSDTFDHEGDAWDSLDGSDWDNTHDYWAPHKAPRCHTCGAICYWIMTNGKWVLHERGQRHVCPPKDNTPEGFE